MPKITWVTVVVLAVLGFVAWHFISTSSLLIAGTKTGTNALNNPTGGSNNSQPDAYTNILQGVLNVYKGFSTISQTAPKGT
jgi:hypothetical protein